MSVYRIRDISYNIIVSYISLNYIIISMNSLISRNELIWYNSKGNINMTNYLKKNNQTFLFYLLDLRVRCNLEN